MGGRRIDIGNASVDIDEVRAVLIDQILGPVMPGLLPFLGGVFRKLRPVHPFVTSGAIKIGISWVSTIIRDSRERVGLVAALARVKPAQIPDAVDPAPAKILLGRDGETHAGQTNR
jgi:hypothetical protein